MGLLGILAGLCLLVWLAFRGWSVLLLAPAASGRAHGGAAEHEDPEELLEEHAITSGEEPTAPRAERLPIATQRRTNQS